jgi:hypothetical protein
MSDATTLDLTATHGRRGTMTAFAGILALGATVLLIGAVLVGVMGALGADTSECRVDEPSDACLAQLPESLQGLPPASLGVWYYAENANVKQSPRRYLEEQAKWAAGLPPGVSGPEAVNRPAGQFPSQAAADGEVHMRQAVLPELWAQEAPIVSSAVLGGVLALGALGMLVAAAGVAVRSRSWGPIRVRVTDEYAAIGSEQVRFEDLMTIDVAPLRLGGMDKDLVLPPGYDLTPDEHERLVEVLQTAMARSRGFDDEDLSPEAEDAGEQRADEADSADDAPEVEGA